jgi:hypothetical protein
MGFEIVLRDICKKLKGVMLTEESGIKRFKAHVSYSRIKVCEMIASFLTFYMLYFGDLVSLGLLHKRYCWCM